jgi:hypothetical protein
MLAGMGEEDGEKPHGEKPQFVFPARVGREVDDEEVPVAVLCSVPLGDAAGFCARLEGQGIPCGAGASAMSDGVMGGAPHADIYVREEDLEVAREILARPPEEDETDEESAAEFEGRCVANWVCPRCRQGLEVGRLSKGVHHLRLGCAGMLLLPLLLGFLDWLAPGWKGTGGFPDWLIVCWLVVGLCMAWGAVLPEREKQCKACGWRSSGKDE